MNKTDAVVELRLQQIRVNAISSGSILTRAVQGIDDFDDLLAEATASAREHQLADIGDVGALAAHSRMNATSHPAKRSAHPYRSDRAMGCALDLDQRQSGEPDGESNEARRVVTVRPSRGREI